jgi:dienelactone hydrolase
MARALSQRLHEHGDPHGHTVLEYPAASHSLGYLLPHLPTGLLPPDITDTTADKAARADAWPKAVTFIRQLVPRPATPRFSEAALKERGKSRGG